MMWVAIDRRGAFGTAATGLVVVASLWVLGCSDSSEAPPESIPPNVVVIVLDTLRADRIEATRNGVPIMPKLAALASQSWWFTQAVAQASWTKPSVFSMLTSLYPGVHEVQFNVNDPRAPHTVEGSDVLTAAFETMATFLKKNGYDTAAIQTNAMLRDVGFEQGFDSYFYRTYPGFPANEVTGQAIRTVEGLAAPFFLYVQYLDSHLPYDPPTSYRTLFGPLPRVTERDRTYLDDWNNYYTDRVFYDAGLLEERKNEDLSEAGREYQRILYDGEARFLDDEVARLIEFIQDRAGDALIIITSDHGEELWEHDSIGHGRTVYEELVHVPMIIVLPDGSGKLTDLPVETIDILPTVAAHAGIDPRPEWQGRNLFEYAADGTGETRPLFSQTKTSQRGANIHLETVALGNEKLIVSRTEDSVALYDLLDDPLETTDLADIRPKRVAELKGLLEAHRRANEAHPKHQDNTVTRMIDPVTQKQIEALGYLGGSKRE